MILIGSLTLVIAYSILTTKPTKEQSQLRPIRIRVKRK